MVDYIKSFDNSNAYDNYKSSPLYARPNVSYIWDKGIVRSDIVAQSGASGTFPNLKGGCLFENAVMDYDGNIYDAVVLGDQVWLGSNLRTTHYADGTPIDEMEYFVVSASGFTNVECGIAYRKFAALSGYTTASTIPEGLQGISPDGWHIPSSGEVWTMLQWLRDEYNISKNPSGYYYDAPPLCSNHGWRTSTTHGCVGYNQEKNNKTRLNLIPGGILLGGDVFQMVTYNMVQNNTWDWNGEYLIVVDTNRYVRGDLTKIVLQSSNVPSSSSTASLFSGETCQYKEPQSGGSIYTRTGMVSFIIDTVENKISLQSKLRGYYLSPNFEDEAGIVGLDECVSDSLFTVSVNQADNSISIRHELGFEMYYIIGRSRAYFISDEILGSYNTAPIWLYKRIKQPTLKNVGDEFHIATTNLWSGLDVENITTNYNHVQMFVEPWGDAEQSFSVRCLYNGTVEEFIKNYRSLNP